MVVVVVVVLVVVVVMLGLAGVHRGGLVLDGRHAGGAVGVVLGARLKEGIGNIR